MHLKCKFYFGCPLVDEARLDALQFVINELLPEWSRSLRIQLGSKMVVVGRDGRLFDCLRAIAPARQGGKYAELIGGDATPSIFMSFSNSSLPPDANWLTIEIFEATTIEGSDVDIWARGVFSLLMQRLPAIYASACLTEEFSAKNMHEGEDGTWALGIQLLDYLPGLYWLNYFGTPYCDLMGCDRILTAPGYEVWPNGEGVIVALGESPEEWNTPAYRQREHEVIEHLGKPYFFSRGEPQRESLAPDFYAIEKKRKG